jgi:putative ABC transport system permease protein
MTTLVQDLKYGARMLAKNPGFTLVAMLALALGIGANTAIFSVVNAVLLRPLPYQDPDRLVFISEHTEQVPDMSVSYPNFLDWQRQNQVFDEIAAFQGQNFNLTGVDRPERLSGWNVSANFLTALGIKPFLGRDFLPQEDQPGGPPVVVVTYGLWQRRFGGDPGLVGRALTLNGRSYTVIGILPASFKFAEVSGAADIYASLGLNADQMKNRGNHPGIYVIARRKAGVSLEQARAQMLTIARGLVQQYPDTNTGNGVVVISMREELVEDVRPALLVLLGAVGLVLLIACANVANLLLARAAAREKEIAIRVALGAGRLRILRQLLTESILLAAAGGGLGLLLGYWGIDGLTTLIPSDFRDVVTISVDRWVLGFTLGVSLLTGLAFGLMPAIHASRSEVSDSLKEGGRSSASASHQRFRSILVASEVALALVLLASAGLMLRSIGRLLAVDPGFNTDNVLTMRVALPEAKYPKDVQVVAFYKQVLERIRALPGVRSASVVRPLPLTGDGWQTDFYLEGRPMPAPGQTPNSDFHMIDPDYLRVMGIPLLKGRAFTEADDDQALRVVLINATMAQRYWPGEDPVGKRIRVGRGAMRFWATVVGIVGDTKQYGLERNAKTEFYLPYLQRSVHSMELVVRSATDPLGLVTAVRSSVEAVDPDQPVYGVRTMAQYLAESVASRRTTMLLLGVFAGLALILAAVGIYGVMAYAVVQRTHEIGVRMALGAGRGDVLKLVVRSGLVLAFAGVAVGLIAALGLTRLMSSLLFGVRPTDPVTLGAVALLLTAVALLASYIPARRATRVDPNVALRYE